jgi:dihydrofolate reductase
MRITLIAAVARNGVIGNGRDLVWRNGKDMAHFRATTMGSAVLMGRKTWDSIPLRFRPLAGRGNIVLSHDPSFVASGAEVYTDISVALANLDAARVSEVFVIGGGQIYATALPHAHRLILTEIDQDLVGDVLFPPFDRSVFAQTSRSQHDGFAFVEYLKTVTISAHPIVTRADLDLV